MKKLFPLLLVITLLLITGCGNKRDIVKDIKKVQTFEDEQIDEGVKAIDTAVVVNGNDTLVKTMIQNTSKEAKYIEYINLILKNKKGEVIKTLIGYVGKKLAPKESYLVTTSINIEMNNVKDIEYEIH